MFPTTSLVLLLLFAPSVHGGCRMDDWWWKFEYAGWTYCTNMQKEYIRGFYRSAYHNPDKISFLEEAMCCTAPSLYAADQVQVTIANWWYSFQDNWTWNRCPHGYFLTGLYRTKGYDLKNIEEGRCMKPASHPPRYGHCYEHDISTAFDDTGKQQCRDNYFVTGFYRGGCESLHCIQRLMCCSMAPRGDDSITSLAKAKTKVMDSTLFQIALLAKLLGYGWTGGCRGVASGEDYRRDGDKWLANIGEPCTGYMHDKRLNLSYDHWKFSIKKMTFGQAVIQDLTPTSIDTGIFNNNASVPVSQKMSRSTSVVRTVTHTTTSAWSHSHELGLSIGYQPPSEFGGVTVEVSYKFKYEGSSSTTNSNGLENTNTYNTEQSITIPAHSAVNFTVILSKTRRTIAYTAIVLIHFSTELQGFLRWGGGVNGANTNYHYQHKGSTARPTFNYRFGDANVPFYKDLKQESDDMQHPWLWSSLKYKYGAYISTLINSLTSEGRYEFKLTGKFDDVYGKDVRVTWNNIPSSGRKKRSTAASSQTSKSAVKKVVAKEEAGDPPSVFPPPPDVQLDPVPEFRMPQGMKMEGN